MMTTWEIEKVVHNGCRVIHAVNFEMDIENQYLAVEYEVMGKCIKLCMVINR